MKEHLYLRSAVEVLAIARDAAKLIITDTLEYVDQCYADALNRQSDE